MKRLAFGFLFAGLIAATAAAYARQTSSTAQKLSRAVTLFATDDAGPEAERLLLQVAQAAPATTNDGATARYYLGRLYHRNYYMLREPKGLERAAERYRQVHNKGLGAERGGPWYAEARFYKSLAFMEQGQWDEAYEAVDHIVPTLDSVLDIDYLVWSLDNRPVNRRVPTDAFKKRYVEILKAHAVDTRRDGADRQRFQAVLGDLQSTLERWGMARAKR